MHKECAEKDITDESITQVKSMGFINVFVQLLCRRMYVRIVIVVLQDA